MLNIRAALSSLFEVAITTAFPGVSNPPVVLAPAQNPKFGDYQCNSAMALSKVKNSPILRKIYLTLKI